MSMRQLKITKSITNRESQSLDKYLQEIGKEELITAEMEVELARRIKQGDQWALEKLTRANLRFVVDPSIDPSGFGRTIAYRSFAAEPGWFPQQDQQSLFETRAGIRTSA